MHLYITRGCRGTLPKFLRSKGRRLRRLKASFVRSSQILESGKWKLVGLQQNEVLMNNRHFFNTNYEHVSVLIKSVWCFFSSSNYWNRAHPEAPFSVRFQSHNIPFKRTSSCLSILIWKLQSLERCCIHGDLNTISDPNLRSKSWWLVEKKGLRRSGFCLGVLECRKERWKASLNIFDLSSNVWRLMIRRFDDCDGVASHWLAIRFERKLTHSRPRLVSRMKTRRCEQPHTMNSCKQMRNSRFFLACMSQTCIVWYVCFGGGKGRTVVIPLKLRVTERSATSLQDLHMRSKMHSTAEPLENNGNR